VNADAQGELLPRLEERLVAPPPDAHEAENPPSAQPIVWTWPRTAAKAGASAPSHPRLHPRHTRTCDRLRGTPVEAQSF
jgi:hypothetical protein